MTKRFWPLKILEAYDIVQFVIQCFLFKEIRINSFWHYWQSFHTRGSISRSQENVLSNTSNIFRLTTFNRALKLLISFDKSMMECWHIRKINDILGRNHKKLAHISRDIMHYYLRFQKLLQRFEIFKLLRLFVCMP